MRTRREIEKDRELPRVACVPRRSAESLILEVALDIREILIELTKREVK